ncbi:hypothetical protein CVV38_01760 [Candidatus Peregrinibacteria bacterium HGW-Peregrinibacteria-1]|jgi:hypothetical protein|nr:MAG: hypothetical protein CVV38_01760 [Candidatus Peregrinibacteria bacterium HGW-Peregrinibacteria-1]
MTSQSNPKTRNSKIKKWLLSGILSLFLFINFIPLTTIAADPTTPPPVDSVNTLIEENITSESLQDNLVWLETIRSGLNFLIWPIIFLIGQLLDNSILFGSGMEERLREIWMVVRNLVNIIFVVVLVGVALYNVLGLGDDNGNYSIKSILPKIIIGIIAVNFSFLAMKVLLDGVNVMTSAVFSLPRQLNVQLDYTKETEEKICQNIGTTSSANSIARSHAQSAGIPITSTDTYSTIRTKINGSTQSDADKEGLIAKINQEISKQLCDNYTTLSELGREYLSEYNHNNAAFAMAIQTSGLLQMSEVDANSLTTGKLVMNTMISIIIYIIYMLSFVALFIVLLGRLVILWIAVAFSPILLLAMAVPVIREKVSFLGDATSKIIQNAIAPITIGVAMTIGILMLDALGSARFLANESGTPTAGIPVAGLGSLQEILISVCTIAVIWIAVFGAAKNTIAGGIVESIKNGALGIAKWTMVKPLAQLPILPTGIKDAQGNPVKASFGELAGVLRDGTRANIIPYDNKLSNMMGLNNLAQDIKGLTSQKANSPADIYMALSQDRIRQEIRGGSQATADALREYRDRNRPAFEQLKATDKPLFDKIDRFITGSEADRKSRGTEIDLLVQQGADQAKLKKSISKTDQVANRPISSRNPNASDRNLENYSNQLNTAINNRNESEISASLTALLQEMGVNSGDNLQNIRRLIDDSIGASKVSGIRNFNTLLQRAISAQPAAPTPTPPTTPPPTTASVTPEPNENDTQIADASPQDTTPPPDETNIA